MIQNDNATLIQELPYFESEPCNNKLKAISKEDFNRISTSCTKVVKSVLFLERITLKDNKDYLY